MNEGSALIKETTERSFPLPPSAMCPQQGDGHWRNRKSVLTRHQISQQPDLKLPSLQNFGESLLFLL